MTANEAIDRGQYTDTNALVELVSELPQCGGAACVRDIGN
jgi:hypothetical protein